MVTDKIIKYLRLTIPALILGALSICCTTEDDIEGVEGDQADRAANQWAYEYMRENYLWKDQIEGSPKYDQEYSHFFRSLLSVDDGKHDAYVDTYYSSIVKYVGEADSLPLVDSRASVEVLTSSYGFDYIVTKSFLYDDRISEANGYEKLYATIVSVTDDSPANDPSSTSKDKLERGMHIYKINGKEIPRRGYRELLSELHAPISGRSSVSFTVCELTQVTDDDGKLVYVDYTDDYGMEFKVPLVTRGDPKDKDKTYTLTSDFIRENPIDSPILGAEFTGSVDVGYLIYNEFKSGAGLHGEEGFYDERLRNAFAEFKSRNVRELIVDLRYNPGGEESSCQLLASLIVSPSMADQTFCQRVNVNGESTPISYLSEENSLGMDKIYVIATGNSASASEMLIHGLRGSGITVHHIGNTTEGKNVGQTVRSTESLPQNSQMAQSLAGYNYLMYPVTFRVEDANGETYPSTGIDPARHGGYVFYEEFVVDLKQLKTVDEPMLAAALYHIKNGEWPASDAFMQPVGRSLATVKAESGSGVPRHYKPSKPILSGGR